MDSPAKRQKTNLGTPSATQGSYNSEADSGDELFAGYETIATVPVERPQAFQTQPTQLIPPSLPHATQPTQFIDRSALRHEPKEDNPSVVQVVASSPLRATPAPKTAMNKPRVGSGGILASAMAPPGTAFRQPFGVQTAPPRTVIDLSDDDGPQYQGDSSDEVDTARKSFDIKASTFAKSGTERVEDSPTKAASKFQEITSNSFYKPLDKSKATGSSLSGSIFDSRNRDDNATSSRFAVAQTAKRPVGAKQGQQGVPQRARVVEDIPLESVSDALMRGQIKRMQRVLPSTTVLACRDALLVKKGNYDDAMDLLVSQDDHKEQVDLTMSDDNATNRNDQAAKQSAKRQVKAPVRTIQDKYSSTQALPKPQSPSQIPIRATPPKPRKRLVQGKKAASTSAAVPAKETPPRSATPESFDDSDSGVEIASDDERGLESKVLTFFNACSVKDLADIANVTTEVAEVILARKPFASLDDVRQISGDAPPTAKPAKRKSTKKAIGDKVVDTCLDTWTGYEAIDELVTKCEALGKPVAEAISKWGFDVFGATKEGELGMVSLDEEAPATVRDSGVGSPAGSPPAPIGDELNGNVVSNNKRRSKQKGAGTFMGQPSNMSPDVELKPYQKVGIKWLSFMFERNLSCILADDMGLGKTCQVIAFLAHLLEQGVKGPHLVVVPGSTLENWLRECRRFAPVLVVEPYYGAEKDRAETRMQIEGNIAQINVVVTTYDLAAKKADNKFLRHLKPTVCVYDEGHALKNSNSLRYAALMRIPAKFRLLLTGTPLQNNLRELAALLGFILPSVFRERKEDLEYIFKHKARTRDSDHAALLSAQRIARAKSMMTPFVLRRKKHQVLKHLPPKTTRVELCELQPAQSAVYNDELQRARDAMQARAEGKKAKNESGNVMMQLRKAAIHPMLFRRIFDDDRIGKMAKDCLKEPVYANSDFDVVLEEMGWMSDFQLHTFCEEHPDTMSKYNIEEDEWMASGKVAKLAELLQKFRDAGDRVLVFSQFTMVLDILEAVMETLTMQYFRLDGQTRIDERQDMIDQFHEEKDITVFLMSTKAGGMGINLACANKVVIFDQSFNPQEDIQAENRAHRVGQQRPVEVIRLVTKGTIEEQIYTLGETKLALDQRVSGNGNGSAAEVVDEKTEEVAEKIGIEMVQDMWLKGEGAVAEGQGQSTTVLAEKDKNAVVIAEKAKSPVDASTDGKAGNDNMEKKNMDDAMQVDT